MTRMGDDIFGAGSVRVALDDQVSVDGGARQEERRTLTDLDLSA